MLAADKIGVILALVGLILLVANGMGRQRLRRTRKPVSGALAWWLQWGGLVAYGLIAAGLWHMLPAP